MPYSVVITSIFRTSSLLALSAHEDQVIADVKLHNRKTNADQQLIFKLVLNTYKAQNKLVGYLINVSNSPIEMYSKFVLPN